MSSNPKSVANVNQKQGPRTGNAGTLAKRSDFVASKSQRAPLADVVQSAFAARGERLNAVDAKLEPISSNSRRKFGK